MLATSIFSFSQKFSKIISELSSYLRIAWQRVDKKYNAFNLAIFKSLPNDKILNWSKLKAFADDKINVTKNSICYGKGRKHCLKGGNAGYPQFLLFPQCF